MSTFVSNSRLLTIYGNEDAPNFIADNTLDSSPRRDRPNSKRQTKFDTELARLIREDTGDGRSIARFLVNVMVGELRSFRPHHRMAAARELLNRGFGKSAHTEPEASVDPSNHHQHSSFRRRNGTQKPRYRRRATQPAHRLGVRPQGPNVPPAPHSHSSPSSPLTPQREAPPLTPHSSPLTPGEADRLSTDLPPQHFEHTVLDLLENMGYGHARHVGRTGDGDIDGIIDQDTLGLDRLYVQAKRWTNPVGEPEIRNFSGSLDAHGATRGILITTSDFTDTARKTAKTISIGTKHIRLVNGHELAHLILKHSIRVTPDTPQHSRNQDKDHHTHHT